MIDQLIIAFDKGLRTTLSPAIPTRIRPDSGLAEADLTESEKQQSAALMRINHVGEVCAQALYSGQSITARDPNITNALKTAANEEIDHLAWCESRIHELGGRKSLLNPVWYAGSFTIGVSAGLLGDQWNLGFLAETEKQVSAHLDSHLKQISDKDVKTRSIIAQMHEDENQHANTAQHLGAKSLPIPIKIGMKLASKVMTATAYYI